MPPDLVGVKTGLLATGGRGPVDVEPEEMGAWESDEYFEPEESATRWIMPSGVRWPSARAVIWT
jgi:hypothetical protein